MDAIKEAKTVGRIEGFLAGAGAAIIGPVAITRYMIRWRVRKLEEQIVEEERARLGK